MVLMLTVELVPRMVDLLMKLGTPLRPLPSSGAGLSTRALLLYDTKEERRTRKLTRSGMLLVLSTCIWAPGSIGLRASEK